MTVIENLYNKINKELNDVSIQITKLTKRKESLEEMLDWIAEQDLK